MDAKLDICLDAFLDELRDRLERFPHLSMGWDGGRSIEAMIREVRERILNCKSEEYLDIAATVMFLWYRTRSAAPMWCVVDIGNRTVYSSRNESDARAILAAFKDLSLTCGSEVYGHDFTLVQA